MNTDTTPSEPAKPAEYFKFNSHVPTTADDPERGIWYSASCGYWTDDWSKLATIGPAIPCCPKCGCPGMHCTAEEWLGGAATFEVKGMSRYLECVTMHKERCFGRGWNGLEFYKRWLKAQEPGVKPHE